MSDQSTPMVPSTPDPGWVSLVAALVRAVLQFAAGFGFTWALTVSGSQATMIATAIVALVTAGWSLWQKVGQARAQHEAAVASASKRKPVEPASPPPPP